MCKGSRKVRAVPRQFCPRKLFGWGSWSGSELSVVVEGRRAFQTNAKKACNLFQKEGQRQE